MTMQRESRIGISMPGINQPMHKFAEMAELADRAAFDTVWGYEFYRNAFVMQATSAMRTSRITLAVGLAAAAQRTPFEMANAAADVDELCGGRLLLCTGPGGVNFAEHFNGTSVDHPATRMREYITIMQKYWHQMATGEPFEFEGKYYRFSNPPINPFGGRSMLRPRIPVYLGAMRPMMLKLAGEMCDGVMSFLVTPEYVESDIHPQMAVGAKKAGRDPNDIDLTVYVITSISEDREEALRWARIQVGCYVAYPIGTFMADQVGLGDDRDAVVSALMSEGPAALEKTTSDALVKALSITGTPDEAREQYASYWSKIPHVVLHTPYVPPLTAPESEAAYKNIITTFGRA